MMRALLPVGGLLLLIGLVLLLFTVYNGIGWVLLVIGIILLLVGAILNGSSRATRL